MTGEYTQDPTDMLICCHLLARGTTAVPHVDWDANTPSRLTVAARRLDAAEAGPREPAR
jgi:hypothetical protein